MDIEEQQGRQDFFNDISNYQYIREDGRLIIEPFGVYLSHCFGFDGVLELSPQPRDVYMLLIDLIREHMGDDEAKRKVQFQKIADWRPELACIYPEKIMTCIHVGALTLVSHDWIYDMDCMAQAIARQDYAPDFCNCACRRSGSSRPAATGTGRREWTRRDNASGRSVPAPPA